LKIETWWKKAPDRNMWKRIIKDCRTRERRRKKLIQLQSIELSVRSSLSVSGRWSFSLARVHRSVQRRRLVLWPPMKWNHRSICCSLESCNESFRTLFQLCLCWSWEFWKCVFQV
jgi:hypothetical protein